MFSPRYKITHRLLNLLTSITASKEAIANAYIVPNWAMSLRKQALIQSAHSSTAIEGNPLTLEEVSELAEGRDIMAQRKAKQEVLNYLDLLDRLPRLAPKKELTEDTILNIHRLITDGVLENYDDVGQYRNRQVVVVNRSSGEITFRPPETQDVPKLMTEFVVWLNHKDTKNLDPVLEAGIVHYEFVRIHPFIDGNGRVARALAALIFYQRGFDTNRFFALDDYYDSDRLEYYHALQSVDPNICDLTEWLEYFAQGVALSVAAVQERVLKLSIDKRKVGRKGQKSLTERQIRIIEMIHDQGQIANRDVREMFGVSHQTAVKEIAKLVDSGLIKSEGLGRNTHYILS
ncbi:MAG: Fic family protein [Chloroflexi bacterium]|jgi:Fic family protein|nr:Fic family protein [Chloroflexota bacterium]